MTTSHYCLQLRSIALANGETLVLDDAPGVVIDATRGLLWVTVTGGRATSSFRPARAIA